MRWAKVVLVLGAVLLVAAFCVGTDTPVSVTVGGRTYECGDVIDAQVLATGVSFPSEATRSRAGDACAPREVVAQVAVWGGLGLGALMVLLGWTVLRDEDESDSSVVRAGSALAGR